MNLFARKAFEGLNVEANRARGNSRQHGSRLVRWAEWSQDGHDAIAFSFRRERYRLSVTGRYRGGGDPPTMEPSIPQLVILLTFEKWMTRSVLDSLGTLPCERPACIEGRASRWRNPNSRVLLNIGCAPLNQSSRAYAQDLCFNAGIAASSVVGSEKAARLS